MRDAPARAHYSDVRPELSVQVLAEPVHVNVLAAFSYAADATILPAANAALTTASFSGLSVTAAMSCQLRV